MIYLCLLKILYKSYDEESDVGYLLVVNIEYLKRLRMLHGDLPFLPEKIKINKCPKVVCNVTDKKTIQFILLH